MRDPLLLPLVAIMAGILLGRGLSFSVFETLWPTVIFLLLAFPATGRLRRCCLGFMLLLAGAFSEVWRRPGPRPQIDAGSRETVLLQGCVVEPSVLAPNREQFTLELDRGARARVSLAFDDGPPAQRLEYGERVEIEARIRPP